MRLVLPLLLLSTALAAQPKLITPADAAKPVGPYSPALDTGTYVYVSGQGVRDSAGAMPTGIEAQTRQCIANVRANLEAAGLEFRHVVSTQLYLDDMANLPTVERIWSELVAAQPPRITLGVAHLPTDTTVEITVVARRTTTDRLYLDAIYGQTRKDVDDKLTAALKKSGLARKHIVMANWYTTTAPAPGVVSVASLPDNAVWSVSAVASKAGDPSTVFCEVVSSSGSGAVEQQTTEAFASLKSCLAKQGATLADLVATNVYLDDLANFSRMNTVYATMFTGAFPTRTTIQPAPPAQAAGIAVRLSGIASKRCYHLRSPAR